MAFPTSPTDGQTAIINNVYYSYVSATNTWTRLVGVIPTLSNLTVSGAATVGNLTTTSGVFWANGTSLLPQGTITMNQPSTLIVPFTGNARFYPTKTVNLKTVYANLGSAPTGANLGFTILKNGSNIGYGFTITTSSAVMTPVDISSSNVSLTTSDYLTINLTGNIAPQTLVASDLSVKITYS